MSLRCNEEDIRKMNIMKKRSKEIDTISDEDMSMLYNDNKFLIGGMRRDDEKEIKQKVTGDEEVKKNIIGEDRLDAFSDLSGGSLYENDLELRDVYLDEDFHNSFNNLLGADGIIQSHIYDDTVLSSEMKSNNIKWLIRNIFSFRLLLFIMITMALLIIINVKDARLLHLIVELFTSFVSIIVFLWSYGSHKLISNNFLHFICIGQLFVGLLNMLHILEYYDFSYIKDSDTHLSIEKGSQLWMVARLGQAINIMIAPLFLIHHQKALMVKLYDYCVGIHVLVLILLLSLIYTNSFVSLVNSNNEYNDFKIGLEYFIFIIFILSIIHLIYQTKNTFVDNVSILNPHVPQTVIHKHLNEVLIDTNMAEDDSPISSKSEFNFQGFRWTPSFIFLIVYILFMSINELASIFHHTYEQHYKSIGNYFQFLASFALFQVIQHGLFKSPLFNITKDLKAKDEHLLHYNSVLAVILNKKDRDKEEKEMTPQLLKFVRDNASDRFQSLISHEIRTPLNAIVGLAEILQSSKLEAEDLEMVKTMYHSGISLVALLNDLLDLSKIEANELVLHDNINFNLSSVLQNSIKLFDAIAKKKHITLSFEQRILLRKQKMANLENKFSIFVCGDELRCSQIIRNLLSNAIKFTPIRGNVKLCATVCSSNSMKDLVKKLPVKNMVVRFDIIDSGTGIPQSKQDSLFEPFKQIDDNTLYNHVQGTGLGLSISKGLVENMKGSIGVYNNVKVGCTFYFMIPFSTGRILSNVNDTLLDEVRENLRNSDVRANLAAMPQVGKVRSEELKSPNIINVKGENQKDEVNRTCHILLVEDSSVNQRVQTLMLNRIFQTIENVELNLSVAENGLEALGMVCRCNFQQDLDGNELVSPAVPNFEYDLILMDQMMPVMGGLECTKEIRKIEQNLGISKRIPIVAQTGLLTSDIHNLELYDGYLAKPITKKALHDIIIQHVVTM